jgi:hypothetical protein
VNWEFAFGMDLMFDGCMLHRLSIGCWILDFSMVRWSDIN